MQLPDLASRRGWVLAASICILFGFGSGWLLTTLPVIAGRQATDDRWTLPGSEVTSRFNANDVRTILASKAWVTSPASGASKGPASRSKGPAAKPAWSLVGTVSRPTPVALIIVDGSPTVARVGLGESLPGVGTVDGVESDGIRLDADGCVVQVKLFQTSIEASQSRCSQHDKQTTVSSEAGDN